MKKPQLCKAKKRMRVLKNEECMLLGGDLADTSRSENARCLSSLDEQDLSHWRVR